MEEIVLHERGVKVIKEGDPADFLVFIKEGDLTIIKENLSDDDLDLLNFLQSGNELQSLKAHLKARRGCVTVY